MKRIATLFYYLFVFLLILSFSNAYSQTDKRQLIKSHTVYQYDISPGGGTGSGKSLSYTEKNKAGYITKQLTYKQDGNVLSEVSKIYDSENKVLEVVTYLPESGVTKNLKHTYENNRIISSESYTNGSLKVIVNQIYEGDNLIEIISRSPSVDQVVFRTVHEYDEEGRVTSVKPYSLNDKSIGEMRYSYGSDGSVSQESIMNGKTTKKKVKKVDSSGNVKEEIIYDSQGRIISRVTNRYNDKGLLIEDTNEMPFAEMKIRNTHRYDDYGLLIESVNYNKLNEPVKLLRMEYDFYEDSN